MRKKIAVLLIYFIPILFNLVLGQDSASVKTVKKSKKQPEFKFESEEINFGQIRQGDSIKFDIHFTNTGKTPLVILGVEGSCGCTEVAFPHEPILKGEQKSLHVTFNSTGKEGLQEKTITIYSNTFTNPKEIRIKGNVLVN